MTWQDIVLTVGQWVFIIALLPSIFSKDKPALWTSLTSGSILVVFAFTFFSLSLLISAISTVFVSVTWFVLALQKYLIMKREKL